MSEVYDIAKPLNEDSDVKFLFYLKHYDDGSFINLQSNREDWTAYVCEKYLDADLVKPRICSAALIIGIEILPKTFLS